MLAAIGQWRGLVTHHHRLAAFLAMVSREQDSIDDAEIARFAPNSRQVSVITATPTKQDS